MYKNLKYPKISRILKISLWFKSDGFTANPEGREFIVSSVHKYPQSKSRKLETRQLLNILVTGFQQSSYRC